MNKTYNHIKNNVLYYLIYIAFIIDTVINLRSKYLSQDESFTFHMIQHSFTDIINLTSQDVHPFLYYFMAKIFTYNIQNIFLKIFILRLMSGLPYLILLIIGNTYIKNNFSKITSELFMFCVISMPLFINNIYEIRMYGWSTLFVTIVYLLFISIYINKKNSELTISIILSIFALLSAYTHYYALITVAILYLLFLMSFIVNKKQIKYLILSIIVDIVFYLPWLDILLKQTQKASNNFWSPKINIKDIVSIIIDGVSPVRHFSIFYFLPIILFILLIIILINKNIDSINMIGLATPFILIFIGYIISKIMGHAVIMDRYITPAMSIFWLSVSTIMSRLNNNAKYKIIQYLLVLVVLATGIINSTKYNVNENKMISQFNSTLQVFDKIPKDSVIIYDNSVVMYSASNYLGHNYILPKRTAEDVNFPIFNKVFNNIYQNNRINIPKNYKNVYYIKSDKYDVNSSTLTRLFNEKHRINDKKQIGKISVPLNINKNGIIYKIK